MSILDINEAASRSAFESLMPGAYASFSDGPVYDREKALKLFLAAKKNTLYELQNTKDTNLPYNQAVAGSRLDEARRIEREALKPFVVSQWSLYGKTAAEDSTINYKKELGADLYNELYLQMFGETDGLEDGINDLTSNKIVVGPNAYEIFYDTNGSVNKIILPKTKEDPVKEMVTDKTKLKEFISAFYNDGLLI